MVEPNTLAGGSCRRVIALIPVHNELEFVHTLDALNRQTRPPDEIYILTDNQGKTEFDVDRREEVWRRAARACDRYQNVSVVFRTSNEYKKAGNLNEVLRILLPQTGPSTLVCGFDADSLPEKHFIERAEGYLDRGECGAVGAVFAGRAGGGVLGMLQRAEFARFGRHQHRRRVTDVLSGTGWVIPAPLLVAIAATRPDGGVYDVHCIVEDFELTLAIRAMDRKPASPSDCQVTTDVMTTVGDWVTQRLRWQLGTLVALAAYGWCKATREMIVRQVMIYLVMVATPLTVVYLAWSFVLFGWAGLDPLHAPLYLAGICTVIAEQAWQARKAGKRAVVMSLLVVPDLLYSLARQAVYLRALYYLKRGRKTTNWGAGNTN